MFDPSPPAIPIPSGYSAPPAYVEYAYHSQFASDLLGIIVNLSGALTDPDNQLVALSMVPVAEIDTGLASTAPPLFSAVASRQSPGVYTYQTSSSDLSQVGYATIFWSFTLGGVAQRVQTWVHIEPPAPAYDQLPQVARNVIEEVHAKFADSFDAPFGGPNLQQWAQTHFGRNRIAQLLYQAVGHLNNVAQPYMWFSADGTQGGLFPYQQWGGLINSALTVEVLKHLMRSYTEDPDLVGNVQARASRRDYQMRWGEMLRVEMETFKAERDTFKITYMFRMQPRALVSGGAYGNFTNVRGFNLQSFPMLLPSFFF